MTISEAQTQAGDNAQPARPIPFPRLVFEDVAISQDETPKDNDAQDNTPEKNHDTNIQFPTSKEFLQQLKANGITSESSGSQIMMLLFEALDLVPKKKELDALTAQLESRRPLRNEYQAVIARAEKGPELTKLKSKLKQKKLTLQDISDEVIDAIASQSETIRAQRAPLQDLADGVEHRFTEYIEQTVPGQINSFGTKIEDIYNATDEFIEGEPLLELTQALRKEAMRVADNGLVAASLTFERFTRFMIFDENRFAETTEDKLEQENERF